MSDILDRLSERCWPHDNRDELCMDAWYVITDLRGRLAEVELRAWSLLGAIERQQPSAQIGATGIGHHASVLRRYLEGTADSATPRENADHG